MANPSGRGEAGGSGANMHRNLIGPADRPSARRAGPLKAQPRATFWVSDGRLRRLFRWPISRPRHRPGDRSHAR
ncbi:hypothetical protein WQQ_32270 [Hydrocarboniphaga effusa AP103]|uniref:Uncharacterized protein n=1 Tax=Hydrocarboniphaga effusa AP103 TaxID=1172194 RepID=I8T6T5_9GAMM|nr:hypothetical protein WQQ_32270 [Hydrocarboniphaga effusa AP103]